MKLNKTTIAILLIMAINIPLSASTYWVSGKITRTLVDSVAYGGCMIALDTSDIGENCGASWVSLDCNESFFSIKSGEQKFASALTALASQKEVSLYVDDTKKVNGYCVARRIDIHQ